MMATVDFLASVYRDAVSAVDIRGSTNRGEKPISPFILLSTESGRSSCAIIERKMDRESTGIHGESDSGRWEFAFLAKLHESKSEAIAKSGFTPAVGNPVPKTGTHDSRCDHRKIP